jgi:hypothetical protein
VYRELRALGASSDVAAQAAGYTRSWWASSRGMLHFIMTITYFDRLGVPRLS